MKCTHLLVVAVTCFLVCLAARPSYAACSADSGGYPVANCAVIGPINSGTSLTGSLTMTNGDLLYLAVSVAANINGNSTVASVSGCASSWTQDQLASESSWASATIFHATANTTGACTITVTLNASNPASGTAYDVPYGSATIDNLAETAYPWTSSPNLASGSSMTTNPLDLLIAALGSWTNGATWNGSLLDSIGTIIDDGPNNATALLGDQGHQELTATGFYDVSRTIAGGNGDGGAAFVAYQLFPLGQPTPSPTPTPAPYTCNTDPGGYPVANCAVIGPINSGTVLTGSLTMTSGDLLYLAVSVAGNINGNTTVASVSGCASSWTQDKVANESGWGSATIFHATANNTTGTCTLTVTLNASNPASGTAYDVPGGSATIDSSAGTAYAWTSNPNLATGTFTTTNAADLLISALGSWTNGATWNGSLLDSTGTIIDDGPSNATGLLGDQGHQRLTATGSYNVSRTIAGNGDGGAAAVAYQLVPHTCNTDSGGYPVANCAVIGPINSGTVLTGNLTMTSGDLLYLAVSVAANLSEDPTVAAVSGCASWWETDQVANEPGGGSATIFSATANTTGTCTITVMLNGSNPASGTVYDVPYGTATIDNSAEAAYGLTSNLNLSSGAATTANAADLLIAALGSWTSSAIWNGSLGDSTGTIIDDGPNNAAGLLGDQGHQKLTTTNSYDVSRTITGLSQGGAAYVAYQLFPFGQPTPSATPTPAPYMCYPDPGGYPVANCAVIGPINSGTSLTGSLTMTSGDLLYLAVSVAGASSNTLVSGVSGCATSWTQDEVANESGWGSATIFHATANTTATCTITVTLDASNPASGTAYDVPAGSATIDSSAGTAYAWTSNPNLATGSATTTHASDLLISALGSWTNGATWNGSLVDGTGTIIDDGPNNATALLGDQGHQALFATGSYDVSRTIAGSGDGGAALVAYQLQDPPCTISNGNVSSGCSITGGDPPAAGPAPGEDFTNLSAGGLFVASRHDLHVAAPMPLDLTRVYRTRDLDSGGTWLAGPFGLGTNIAYNMFLYSSSEVTSGTYTDARLVLPDGGQVICSCSGTCGPGQSGTFQCNANPGPLFGATISYNSSTSGWNLTDKHRTVYSFGAGAPLQSITDRYGNSITVTRSDGTVGKIIQITSSNGRSISFTYGDLSHNPDQVTQATDGLATVSYSYDQNTHHRMTSSVDAVGTTTTYAYVNTGNQLGDLKTVTLDKTGLDLAGGATYNASFQLKGLTGALGGQSFSYTSSGGHITECDVTTTPNDADITPSNTGQPNPVTRKLLFNSAGYVTTDEQAAGTAIEADYTYYRDSSSNLITSVYDPLGRTTAYCYDSGCGHAISLGNPVSVTYLSGTLSAVSYSYAYDSNFNELDSITDPLGHTWSADIDSSTGNVDSVTVESFGQDTTGATWNILYNTRGQLTSSSDPGFYSGGGSVTTSFGYNSYGDLTSIMNGAGNTTTFGVDAVGRVTSVTDPLNETRAYQYYNNDQLKSATDPNSLTTNYYYDNADTLIKVTDPNGHSQTFTPFYDFGVMVQCDALGAPPPSGDHSHCTQLNYDSFGNLRQTFDGREQVTDYSYDYLNRLKAVDYDTAGDNIKYTWDLGNRLTVGVDSAAGTITRGYDLLDNLTSEASPQGTVSYTYDAASRRITMSVPNQAETKYLYDNANQLCAITQGSSLPSSCPDWGDWSSGELLISRWLNGMTAEVWLPDGAVNAFAYNNDYTLNTVLTADYLSGWSTLTCMTDTRDAAGRLTQVTNYTGYPTPSVNIPAAAPTASYLANNQLSRWNGTNVSEDNNGNLKSDGQGNRFVWNDRNQLEELNTPTVAELLRYDAFGRRQHVEIVNSRSETNFLYDGLNPVQEQDINGSETANLLTGLGLDEIFTRTDASGTMGFLTDQIGSTYGLVNSSGTLQTTYSYGPFGATTTSGTANGNPYKLAGRELDPNSGLYFMRNRYYSPTLSRFISPDPSGLAVGDVNLYAYAHNDPTNLTDPLGLLSTGAVGAPGTQEGRIKDYQPKESEAWFYFCGEAGAGCNVPFVTLPYELAGLQAIGGGLQGVQALRNAPPNLRPGMISPEQQDELSRAIRVAAGAGFFLGFPAGLLLLQGDVPGAFLIGYGTGEVFALGANEALMLAYGARNANPETAGLPLGQPEDELP